MLATFNVPMSRGSASLRRRGGKPSEPDDAIRAEGRGSDAVFDQRRVEIPHGVSKASRVHA
jgi:hypothetical protein